MWYALKLKNQDSHQIGQTASDQFDVNYLQDFKVEELDYYVKNRNYWKRQKNKLKKEGFEVVSATDQLKLRASDGEWYTHFSPLRRQHAILLPEELGELLGREACAKGDFGDG